MHFSILYHTEVSAKIFWRSSYFSHFAKKMSLTYHPDTTYCISVKSLERHAPRQSAQKASLLQKRFYWDPGTRRLIERPQENHCKDEKKNSSPPPRLHPAASLTEWLPSIYVQWKKWEALFTEHIQFMSASEHLKELPIIIWVKALVMLSYSIYGVVVMWRLKWFPVYLYFWLLLKWEHIIPPYIFSSQ